MPGEVQKEPYSVLGRRRGWTRYDWPSAYPGHLLPRNETSSGTADSFHDRCDVADRSTSAASPSAVQAYCLPAKTPEFLQRRESSRKKQRLQQSSTAVVEELEVCNMYVCECDIAD